MSRPEAARRLLRGVRVRSRRRPERSGPGPGLGRRGRSSAGSPRPEPRRNVTWGRRGAREYASAGMGQQVGRVGEAPGLQQPQPRGIRVGSVARPSGRRRDLAGRTAEAGFNIFTQHGECVWERREGAGRPGVGLGRGGEETGGPGGSGGGGVPESGGGIRCHLGQSRESSHTPPPSRLQPGWQLPGAEKERAVGSGTVEGLSSPLGQTVWLGEAGG